MKRPHGASSGGRNDVRFRPKPLVDCVAKGLVGLERWRVRGRDGDALAGAGIAVRRAGRILVEKAPKLANPTVSPLASASVMVESVTVTAAWACVLGRDILATTRAHGSSLAIQVPTLESAQLSVSRKRPSCATGVFGAAV